jgi:hypothetical protein
MFSPQLMAQDKHEGKGQDKHKKHKDNRQKYYCKDYREKYHHGHHRHYIRDSHGRYIPYYVEGFHEHCNNYSGYYDSQGSFIEIYVDGQGSSNVDDLVKSHVAILSSEKL